MGIKPFWASTASVLFRTAVWAYLRRVPFHKALGPIIVVTLVLYYLALFFQDASHAATTKKAGVTKDEILDVKITEDSNGIPGKRRNISAELVVAASVDPQPSLFAQIVTLGLSLPTRSKTLSLASLAINTLLIALCIDFTYTPYLKVYDPTFTRVGAVDSSSAKILVRYPALEEQHQLRIVYRQVAPGIALVGNTWKDGPVLDIEEDKDYTAVGKLARLWPSSDYEYRLAYLNGTLLPYPETPIPFHTFPDPRMASGVHFRFLTSSSQLPNFPYNPFTSERIKGWDVLNQYIWPHAKLSTIIQEALKNTTETLSSIASNNTSNPSFLGLSMSSAASSAAARLASATNSVSSIFAKTVPTTSQRTPDFMLFVGDFIYADLPNWGGGNLERYHQLYKRVYASPSFRKVYEKLPIFTTWGDHDIINNFAGEDLDSKSPFFNASSAYSTFLGNANPDPVRSDVHYYNFRYGDNAFFVLDTQRHRTEPKAKIDVSSEGEIHIKEQNSTTVTVGGDDLYTYKPRAMLGDKQLTTLYSWLGKVNSTATFKFIVSSVPLTTLWKRSDGAMDSWAAYPEERSALLDVLEYVPNVIVISGDRHGFAVVELRGKILEISASPLSMSALPSYTLRKASKKLIDRSVTANVVHENGTVSTVEMIEPTPEEKTLFYRPTGQHKLASFDVDTTDRNAPTVKIEAVINGKSVKEFIVEGKPVALSANNALGRQIASGFTGLLDRLGLNPLTWL